MKIKNIINFFDCMFDAFTYSVWLFLGKITGLLNAGNIIDELTYWNKLLNVSEDIISKSNSSEIKSLRLQIKIILCVLNLFRTK